MSLIMRLLLWVSLGTLSAVLAGCYGVAYRPLKPRIGPDTGPVTSGPIDGLEAAEPCVAQSLTDSR